MLSKLTNLSLNLDGIYATDSELAFMDQYLASFPARVTAYAKIQAKEQEIVAAVETKIKTLYPQLLVQGGADFHLKWRQDTLRSLRFAAATLLIDDPEYLKEKYLYWFQTIMQAFGTEKICDLTYELLQETVQQQIPEVAELLCPILEVIRNMLGKPVDRTLST